MSLTCEHTSVKFPQYMLLIPFCPNYLMISMDANWSFALKSYTPSWKRHRRIFTQILNPVAARVFLQQQVTTTHTLLRLLLHDPTELKAHVRHAAANIILGIAYGYEVQPVNDPLVKLADRSLFQSGQGISPGKYLVNVFPWRESCSNSGLVYVLINAFLAHSQIYSVMVSWNQIQSICSRNAQVRTGRCKNTL
jgi:hypothetical protein